MDDADFVDLAKAGLKNRRASKIPLYSTEDHEVLALVFNQEGRSPTKRFMIVCRTLTFWAVRVTCQCKWMGQPLRGVDWHLAEGSAEGFACDFTSTVRTSGWDAMSLSGSCVALQRIVPNCSIRVLVEWSVSGRDSAKGSAEIQVF